MVNLVNKMYLKLPACTIFHALIYGQSKTNLTDKNPKPTCILNRSKKPFWRCRCVELRWTNLASTLQGELATAVQSDPREGSEDHDVRQGAFCMHANRPPSYACSMSQRKLGGESIQKPLDRCMVGLMWADFDGWIERHIRRDCTAGCWRRSPGFGLACPWSKAWNLHDSPIPPTMPCLPGGTPSQSQEQRGAITH